MISPGKGGSDDNSDGPTVLQSNPPLSGKALMYQQYLESKQNDTTMNVPGDNVVTDVIFPGGARSHDKSNEPTVLPSNSPLSGKTLLYQHDLENGKGGKYRTGKLASSTTSQCLYHDFLPCICATSFQMTFIFLSILSRKSSLIQHHRQIGAP